MGDNSKIAEGVKITELRSKGDAVTLERKAKKLEGVRQYRLNDYKKLTKDKSFQEFSHTPAKQNSLFELSLTPLEKPPMMENTEDLKSKTVRVERSMPQTRGKSEHEKRAGETHKVLGHALGRGLPFIRTKGLRFYDIGGMPNKSNRFQTL